MRQVLVALLLSLAAPGAVGAAPAVGTPPWLEPASGAEAWPEAEAVYLRHEREMTCDAAGRVTRILRQTIRILRPGGRRFEHLELPWIGSHQLLEVHHARTILADGRTIEVGDVALEQVMPGYYGERLGAVNGWRLNFPYVEPGAVIDWEVAITDQRPSLPDGFCDRFAFQLDLPVHHAAYLVRLPAGQRLQQEVQGEVGAPTVRRHGPVDETSWTADDLPALPAEPGRPGDERLAASVLVSAVESWSAVAQRYRELALPMYPPDAVLREVVATARAQADPALALYQAVTRQIRYGFGGFERGVAGMQPLPAYQTWRRRQGDCKDQATLLLTLLQEAGVAAWPALARRRVRGPLVESLPGVIQFDHVLVAVADGPGWRFFDPTFSFGPVGYLPADLHGVRALIVRDHDEVWATLPTFEAGSNRFDRRADIALDAAGGLAGEVVIQASGGFEQSLRERFAGATSQQAETEVAMGLNAALGGVRFEPGSLRGTAAAAFEEPYEMRYRFTAAGYALQTRHLLLIRPAVFQQAELPAGLALDGRTQPLELAVAPEQTVNEIRFRIPAMLRLLELPEDQAATAPCGSFAIRYRREGDTVLYHREVILRQAEIPAAAVPAVRTWYQALLEADRELIVLSRTAAR